MKSCIIMQMLHIWLYHSCNPNNFELNIMSAVTTVVDAICHLVVLKVIYRIYLVKCHSYIRHMLKVECSHYLRMAFITPKHLT